MNATSVWPLGLTADVWGADKKWVVLRCPAGYVYDPLPAGKKKKQRAK